MDYVNYQPPSHYEVVLTKSKSPLTIDQVKKQAFVYMSQLEGWCSNEKAAFLIDLIYENHPKVIVEIGVWGGKSLIPMAYALKTLKQGIIYGIDPWESKASVQWITEDANKNFWDKVDHEKVFQGLVKKIDLFGLKKQISLVRSTSEAAPPIFGIDILHVDGNHSDYTSYLDVTKWVPLVNSGGWIILDDMTWNEKGVYTVSRAVEWLDQNCIRFADFTDICQWGVWRKP
jgi:predicted O-methyltransferase YrrM